MNNVFWLIFTFPVLLAAQTATLRGVISDASGAVIPAAVVNASGPGGERSATTGSNGAYILTGLRPGDYTVRATTPDLLLPQPARVSVDSGTTILNLQLTLATIQQQITVTDTDASTVGTDAAGNASATTIQGKDLDALSDDPEDLQADLQALAGPGAGQGGESVFVDGFSGTDLPSKESIREIRINQNPFSPEYDRIGLGRIEILTKPGADKLRGSIAYNHMGDSWNARNPYAAQKATLQLNELRGELSGPINRRTSFAVTGGRDAVDNGSIVNAVILDPRTLDPTPFSAVPTTRQRRFRVSPRLDDQLSANHTLTLRYSFLRADVQDAGIGSFDIPPTRGYRALYANQFAQATETAVLGTTVNETRLQFYRGTNEIQPNEQSPTLVVLASFAGGGAQTGHAFNTYNSYELQNYTTMIRGGHAVKFGVRARLQASDSISPQNYNGTFIFAGGDAPPLDANNRPVPGAPLINIQSIERYRRTLLFQQSGYSSAQIRALGGGASQFSLNAGIPQISGHQMDVGVFAGDDWKLRPNLTLSAGIRYEAQTNIGDVRDWAPRVGLAWGLGGAKKPKTVLRAGFGIFYDRFGLNNTLTARRYNGIRQQQYLVTNPDFFPSVPAPSLLSGLQSTQVIQAVDSSLRSPYVMQSMVSLERQLPAGTTVAITYTTSRGVHTLRSLDLNAPLPGSGVYPLGTQNPWFAMTSSGLSRQNQLMTNVTAKVNRRLSLTGYYSWNRARSDSDGLGTFPANPYDYAGEYGPSANDIRHTVNASGSIETFWNIRLNPLINIQSGRPFDITTGSDLFGTALFNSRPGLVTGSQRPGLIATSYGLLDPNPVPGEFILPRNYGRGPGQLMVSLRITKTIGFGGDPKGGNSGSDAHRYNLSIALSVRNLLNHTNPGPIIGNITSPLFGQANQMAGGGGGGFSENANNRRLEMQTRFTF
jgi:carboxypeptidase family protein